MPGLYLHIPYCDHKCLYCDFYSVESLEGVDRFLSALSAEITAYGAAQGRVTFDSVFFGGGTPSLLDASVIGGLLDSLRTNFRVDPEAEVTLETNPGTVDAAKLRDLRGAGVNRLSVGIQSFHDDELKTLTRIHTADVARECVLAAYDAGFSNLSIDLIFALPDQTPERWEETLEQAVALRPPHISAYCLIYEEGTPLVRMVRAKQISPLPGEAEARLYELTMRRLRSAGYEQYEISNFAKPGYRCRHNLTYWRHGNYLGFGPSAHSFRGDRRWWNVSSISVYTEKMLAGTYPIAGEERLGPRELFEEKVMLGLRTGSLDLEEVRLSTGVEIGAFRGNLLPGLVEGGLATFDPPVLRLTDAGFLVCDEVSARILSC